MSEPKEVYGDANIVRVKKDSRYFVASNVPFNDKRLSWEARGVMGYLLSKPDDWQVSMVDLERQSEAGMKVIRRILAELRKNGYMSRERVTASHGRFQWITTLYESPELNQSTIYPSRIDGSSIDGERVDILSTELDLKKKETAEVFKFYQENIEILTQYNSMKLGDLIDDYTSHWVMEALKDCVEYGARNLKYCTKILEGWKAKGFRSDNRSKEKASKYPTQPTKQAAPIIPVETELMRRERLGVAAPRPQ
jgi:DnaD/phage-associated family protein